MARAYILIRSDVGMAEQVREALSALPGITEANIVAGDHDIVAVAETGTAQDLGRLVMREVHGVPGVRTTTTYVVVS